MSRRHSSPRLRYLKARLSILARPSFLVAVVFLSAVGLVTKEYWTNPDFLKSFQNTQISPTTSSNQTLSEEDRAIAADIDNLSVLDYDKRKANIPVNPNIKDSNKIKKENEAQLSKILDVAKQEPKADEINPNTNSQATNIPSISQENPFLKQAKDLLQFNINPSQKDASVNNLSPFSATQIPQSSFNLGINNTQTQNALPESALQTAINQSSRNSQTQDSAANTSIDKNNFGQLPQTQKSPVDRGLRQNQSNQEVDTTIFNQPLNTQPQNPYNNQLPTNNYTQPGLNNQFQNPYDNNNNQFPANNYTQPGLNNQAQNPYGNNNNQFPANNYTQPGLNNQFQNPYGNNNNQVPENYVQPTNPYNNFNNNPQQNPYTNFNNNQIRNNGYSPQTRTRINNIYNKLTNRNNPIVTPNTYTAPNNINTGLVQPNVQQFNSPYSQQNPAQYPNGYRY
ncbi:MAG: hypothetical protein WBA41_11595 [Rivularia sp. (in: cyanobacteria)]